MNSTHHLILASNSPRRQQLLKDLGFEFEVFTRDFDESFPQDLPSIVVAEFLAIKKNHNYRELRPYDLIITSDTTVICDDQVLNKASSKEEAKEMLNLLSGRTHQVVSGVCISSSDKEVCFSDITEVTFESISDNEMDYYIDHFKPFDKAGAYGIQEWIGMAKISSINGSYFTVMGLPTHLVYKCLVEDFGIQL
ncbi:MAG: septum formation protein Maf [Rickettsiales bacterium]|nr:septum formation protein Maf [Rickettsiales bacterium]